MTEPRVIAEIRLVHPELVLTPTIDRVPEVVSELESQTIVPPDVHYLSTARESRRSRRA